MTRPKIIEWPDRAKICVTFIIPWEIWPQNFATRESLQRHGSHTIPQPNAVFKQNLAAVTEREYGDRVGIWRIMDMFARHNLKITFIMNGLKVRELRLAKAKTFDKAKAVLDRYLPEQNRKFSNPAQAKSAWRQAHSQHIDRALCFKEKDPVANDHTVSFDGGHLSDPQKISPPLLGP